MKTKNILLFLFALGMVFSCTDEFDEANTNPYQVPDESLKQDFQHIGSKFQPIMMNLMMPLHWKYQIGQNLTSDSWVRYMSIPTPFVGGINNTTYKMVWKDTFWSEAYGSVMGPATLLAEQAVKEKAEMYAHWANLLKILAISRLTTFHGPVIYSDFGNATGTVNYDSEEDLYPKLFKDLSTIHAAFKNQIDFKGFIKFDLTAYGGKIKNWLRLINSLRLRLAVRISKVSPALAKEQAELAVADEYGLILSNDFNFEIHLTGQVHPLNTIANSWLDTRMSASMESILCGYKDGRLSTYFSPATDKGLKYVNHPDLKYKGIRCGAELDSKDTRTGFSTIGDYLANSSKMPYLMATEMYFALAEAALRGWNVPESAQSYYEKGVRISFAQWKAQGVDEYLADNTSTPLDYDDEKVAGDVNDFKNKISITVKWDEGADNETKLERIITQKWIAGFPDSFEPWVDFRRTGYPKLPYNYKNDSFAEDGIIDANDFIKRMRLPESEMNQNKAGYDAAVATIKGGEDKVSARLWWDTGNPNF